MYYLTCCFLSGMGCRSSKNQNSVADEDNVDKNVIDVDSKNVYYTETSDNNSNKGVSREKKLPAVYPQYYDAKNKRMNKFTRNPERPFTQSQADFFEMLDRKINAGKEYSSEDDSRR